MSGASRPDATSWWDHPDLIRIWELIADRLEREGLQPRGRVTAGDLSHLERRALSDLVGHSVLRDRERVDLALLEQRLRDRAGVGLVVAAGAALARPLVDRVAARAAQAARREEPLVAYQEWMAEHPDLADWGLDEWLDGLRRDGVLARDPEPAALVRHALEVLWARRGVMREVGSDMGPGVGAVSGAAEPVARTQLAAELFGDAHALDDDRRLAAIVLRAALLLDPEPPAHQREAWERLGVLTDRVSSTCLSLGLVAASPVPGVGGRLVGDRLVGDRLVGDRLEAHRRGGAALHLTWRDLDDGLEFASGQTVLVSENPRVVEAAAELGLVGLDVSESASSPIGFVSTSGRPALVTLEVLSRLRSAGARLLYHGDFDWAGLAIANDLVHRLGVEPWRMNTEDYLALPARLPLGGKRVEAGWDAELAAAMEHRGLAVHEEAALPALLHSLPGVRVRSR